MAAQRGRTNRTGRSPRRGAPRATPAVAAMLLAAWCASCAPPAPETPPGAATRPATRPVEAPLPERARVPLDELSPEIPAPKPAPRDIELPKRAKELTLRGEKLLDDEDFDAARRALDRAVGFAPDHPRIRRALGLAYAGLDNVGKAVANLRRSTSAAPDDLRAQTILGWAALGEGKVAEALRRFRTARKCDGYRAESPHAGEALLGLIRALAEAGYWRAALDASGTLTTWIDAHGRAYADRDRLAPLVFAPERLIRLRGGLLLQLRRYEEAAEHLERAFRRDRLDEQTPRLLTAALLKMEAYDRAEAFLVELASEPAQRGQVASLTGKLCRAADDPGAARRIWDAYRRANPAELDANLAASLARAAEETDGPDAALAILRPVAEEMPADARIAQALARLYVGQGQPARALDTLAAALAGDVEQVERIAQAVRRVAAAAPSGTARRLLDGEDGDGAEVAARRYVAGVVARQAGKPYLAATAFEQAAAAKPDFRAAYEAWMDVLLATEQYGKTPALLRRLGEAVGDEDAFTLYLKGKALLVRRRPKDAVAALNRALDTNDRHTPSLLTLAWALERQGRADQAYRRLMEELRRRSEDAELVEGLFDRLTFRQQWSAAEQLLEIVRRSRDGSLGDRLTAELHLHRGQLGEAVEAIKRFRAAAGDPYDRDLLELWARGHRSNWLMPKSEWVTLTRRLGKLADLRPSDPRPALLLRGLLALGGRHGQAADRMQRLYRRLPANLYVEQRCVLALLAAERHEAALRHAEGMLKENPDGMWALDQAVNALVALERTDRAVELLREAVAGAEDPRLRVARQVRLLDLYERTERPREALEAVDKWLPDAPQVVRDLFRAARIEFAVSAGLYDRAVQAARDWSEDEPDTRSPWQQVAVELSEADQHDRAIALLRERIESAERDADKDVYRGTLLLVLGKAKRLEQADALAEKWMARQPYARQPRELLVAAYVQADPGAALEHVDRWLKTLSAPAAETRPTGRGELVSALRRTALQLVAMEGKHAEMLRRAQRYCRDEPDNVELWEMKSAALGELDRRREAIEALEKAYELQPDSAMLNNNLGYMYADSGVKLDQAEAMIRKALSERPDEASFQDSLAWVLYKKARFRPAGRILHAVIGGGGHGEHPVVLDHAGDAYYRLEWTGKAEAMWRRAVEAAAEMDEPDREVRRTHEAAKRKLEALRAGRPVEVAPVGEGVEVDGE
ncbi:MAG: tetratricopeptide repeat protein [Planctomycetota bacterium]